jgi:small subunit ribosomal protein S21
LLYVKVHKNNIEKALRIFKKQVKESKLLVELRDREFYTKPSVSKREKRAKARLRAKKFSKN